MTEKQPSQTRYGGRPMEVWISRVLILGVVFAATIILAGLLIFLIKGSADSQSLKALVDQQKMAVSFSSILRGVARADGRSLIQLGLLALILTPIARVAMSLFLFLQERDRVFALITGVVLCVLLIGLIGSALS